MLYNLIENTKIRNKDRIKQETMRLGNSACITLSTNNISDVDTKISGAEILW
jgi:hypothetical protein